MKVEITSCQHIEYWYLNKLGEIFEVVNYDKDAYLIAEGEYADGYFITKSDCKIIEE
jgi:hypothetical protein